MNTTTKFPVTLAKRLELGPEIVRFSASWEEYLDLLEEADYNIEFENHEILAMSIASDPHEAIVKNILVCLSNALDEDPTFHIRGSNRHVFIKEFGVDYAPDAHVTKGKPQFYTLRKGLTANLNPWLVVEVLSPSTNTQDWRKKLPRYKKIPSLQHIIYVEQDWPHISLFNRMDNSAAWENTDYDQLGQSFTLSGKKIALTEVYKKIDFPEKK